MRPASRQGTGLAWRLHRLGLAIYRGPGGWSLRGPLNALRRVPRPVLAALRADLDRRVEDLRADPPGPVLAAVNGPGRCPVCAEPGPSEGAQPCPICQASLDAIAGREPPRYCSRCGVRLPWGEGCR